MGRKKAALPGEVPEVTASSLVPMTRSEADAKGGPITADVHPDEVSNYAAGGWRIKEN